MSARRTPPDCPIPPCALGVDHPPPHVSPSGVKFVNEGTADAPVLRVLRTGERNHTVQEK